MNSEDDVKEQVIWLGDRLNTENEWTVDDEGKFIIWKIYGS